MFFFFNQFLLFRNQNYVCPLFFYQLDFFIFVKYYVFYLDYYFQISGYIMYFKSIFICILFVSYKAKRTLRNGLFRDPQKNKIKRIVSRLLFRFIFNIFLYYLIMVFWSRIEASSFFLFNY